MKESDIIKKKLLEAGRIRNIAEIEEMIPSVPCYVGPGRWIRAMKELYALKTRKQ